MFGGFILTHTLHENLVSPPQPTSAYFLHARTKAPCLHVHHKLGPTLSCNLHYVQNVRISNAGLRALTQLTNLEVLNLNLTSISHRAKEYILQFKVCTPGHAPIARFASPFLFFPCPPLHSKACSPVKQQLARHLGNCKWRVWMSP